MQITMNFPEELVAKIIASGNATFERKVLDLIESGLQQDAQLKSTVLRRIIGDIRNFSAGVRFSAPSLIQSLHLDDVPASKLEKYLIEACNEYKLYKIKDTGTFDVIFVRV